MKEDLERKSLLAHWMNMFVLVNWKIDPKPERVIQVLLDFFIAFISQMPHQAEKTEKRRNVTNPPNLSAPPCLSPEFLDGATPFEGGWKMPGSSSLGRS